MAFIYLFIHSLIAWRKWLLQFARLSRVSAEPLWLHNGSHRRPTSMSGPDKGKSPTADLGSPMSFCYAFVWSLCAGTLRAQHTHKTGNLSRDVVTSHCHVYNSTSPGFSLIKRRHLCSRGLCLALESLSYQQKKVPKTNLGWFLNSTENSDL